MNEPITIRVRKARSNVKAPEGMEISMNADGSWRLLSQKKIHHLLKKLDLKV